MKKIAKVLFIVLFLGKNMQLFAQNNRINTRESIGWYNYFGTFKLTSKVSLHTEAGYLNQIVQFGRQINGQPVFQNNNGLILNAHLTY